MRAPALVGSVGKGVDHASEDAACQWLALLQDVGRRHPAQIAEQAPKIAVSDIESLDVRDRQRKACPHQQIAGGADVDLRMQSRCRAVGLSDAEGSAQRRQASGTDERAKKESVGAQYAPDQRQCAGQVVDLVEHAGADYKVEAGVGKWQLILIGLDAVGRRGKRTARIAARDAGAGRRGKGGIETPEIQDVGERPRHRIEPLADPVEHRLAEKVVPGINGRGTIAAAAARGAVEDFWGWVEHGALVPRTGIADKGYGAKRGTGKRGQP